MPDKHAYEVMIWIIEGKFAVTKFGVKSYSYSWAKEFASAAHDEYDKTTSEGGFIIIKDLSDGRELDRLNFEKATMVAATA